jgi:hypothetical protein
MSARPDRAAIAGTLAVALVGLVAFGTRALGHVNVYDDFIPLVGAQRLLAGDVPYRDFHSHYPPLLLLLDALVLGLAPGSLLATRLVFALLMTGACVAAGRVAARLARSEVAGALLGAAGALGLETLSGGATIALAAGFIVAAVVVLESPGSADPRARLASAGGLLGLAGLARHDLTFVASVPLVVLALVELPRTERRRVAWLVAPALLVALVALVTLAREGALGAAWRDGVAYGPADYAAERRIPWPWRGDLAGWSYVVDFYGPFVVALAVAGRVMLERSELDAGEARHALAACAITFVGYATAVVRSDLQHVVLARLAALGAAGTLARRPLRGGRAAGLLLASAVLGPAVVRELPRVADTVARVAGEPDALAGSGPRRGLLREQDLDPDRKNVVELLRARPEGSRIWVGLTRHQRIWGTDVALYFDGEALPAGRHLDLTPMCAREAGQRELVEDLERARPPLLVLENLATPVEPNESAVFHDVFLLDAYIAKHYRVKKILGGYAVLERLPD